VFLFPSILFLAMVQYLGGWWWLGSEWRVDCDGFCITSGVPSFVAECVLLVCKSRLSFPVVR
jgi:hypothetical protein